MIRVLVVDDHEVVRLGLKSALGHSEDLEFVGDAANADDALQKALSLRPDVVLMDVRLTPDDNFGGVEACRLIRSALPEAKVIMFSSFGDQEAVMAAIVAGATGYMTKNLGLDQLQEAIRSAAAGRSLLDPEVTGPILERLRGLSAEESASEHRLTDREREVLSLVAEGLTNREIASRLTVSEHTARNHVANLLNKLGFSRRVEAATYAVKKGLVSKDPQS